MTSNVKRYGDPAARCPDCGLWGGQMLEEPDGDYVTHADCASRESEILVLRRALADAEVQTGMARAGHERAKSCQTAALDRASELAVRIEELRAALIDIVNGEWHGRAKRALCADDALAFVKPLVAVEVWHACSASEAREKHAAGMRVRSDGWVGTLRQCKHTSDSFRWQACEQLLRDTGKAGWAWSEPLVEAVSP